MAGSTCEGILHKGTCQMKTNLSKLTTTQLEHSRDLFNNARLFSQDARDKLAFARAERGIERELRNRKASNRRLVQIAFAVMLFLILLLTLAGCRTVDGFRADLHKLTEVSESK